MKISDYAYEAAFALALQGIAQGATRDEVRIAVHRDYAILDDQQVREVMADALDDALSCGIEREDIDESWFR